MTPFNFECIFIWKIIWIPLHFRVILLKYFCIRILSIREHRIWDIYRKLLHEKDILSLVLSTWRFHASPRFNFYGASIVRSASRRSPAYVRDGRALATSGTPFDHNEAECHPRVAVSHKRRKIEGRVTPALCNLSLRVRVRPTATARRKFHAAVSLSLNYSLTRVPRDGKRGKSVR
jgi:hypothetical protein